MKSKSNKLTFRFPGRLSDEHKPNHLATKEQDHLASSVAWSEWNAFSKEEEDLRGSHIQGTTDHESETERVERWISQANNDTDIDALPEPSQDKETESSVVEVDLAKGSLMRSERPQVELFQTAHVRRRSPSIAKIMGSVFGAVATGVLFGFLALSLFKGEVELPSVNTSVPVMASKDGKSEAEDTGKSVQATHAANPSADESKGLSDSSAAKVKVDIPAAASYVLQYGVFSKAEGAEKAVAELQQMGLSGVLASSNEQQRVYAAVSLQKDDAMLLSEALQAKRITLYVRTLERPARSELAFQGDADTLSSFIKQSDTVREWLIKQSSRMLQQTKLEMFLDTDMDKLRTEHLRWTQWGQQLQQSMSQEDNAQWLKLVQSMNTAISAVNEYNKKPSSSHLWNIQQACMQYMLLESDWLSQMDL